MEYAEQFERDFMQRTLTIVREYQGQYDATMLLNCLLGLLIVPKEKSIEKIPNDPISELGRWGISPGSIKRFGKCECGHRHPETLRQLVKSMRNAIAHFRIDPVHENRKVSGFKFTDRSGFHAVVKLSEVQEFVSKLAAHIEQQHA